VLFDVGLVEPHKIVVDPTTGFVITIIMAVVNFVGINCNHYYDLYVDGCTGLMQGQTELRGRPWMETEGPLCTALDYNMSLA